MATKLSLTKPEVFKCLQCRKFVLSNQNSICCDKCDQWIHLRCSKMKIKDFKELSEQPEAKFYCNFCLNYPCGKCDKPVYNHHNSLFCEAGCGKWFHLKCTNVTLNQYNLFTRDPSLPSWCCIGCYMPPFHDLNDIEIGLEFFDNDFETSTREELSKKAYDTRCSVCARKIMKNKFSRALACRSCASLVHRRCSGISNYDLLHSSSTVFQNWECVNCHTAKFAFNEITDDELAKESFDSNFDCSCQEMCSDIPYKKNLLLELAKFQKEEKYGPDPENNIDKCYNLNVDFNYYTLHQFHKLVKVMEENEKYFSIYHTNIESLQCNFEN